VRGTQKQYGVKVVDHVPGDRPWAFIEFDGQMWFTIEPRLTSADLEDAWCVFRETLAETG
jgi:hypothetical protein